MSLVNESGIQSTVASATCSRTDPTTTADSTSSQPLSKYGIPTEPPRDIDVFSVPDDTYSFLAKGRDFEPSYVNHQYTSKEKETLASFESLDYLPAHSDVYKNWIRRQKSYRFEFDRWVVMGLIGFSVGLIGFLLHQVIEIIFKWKWIITKKYIEMGEYEVGWAVCLLYTLLFVVIAASTVVYLRPSASGSGIPEVIGFLNGTVVRHIFNVKTMVVKFVSCVCAIGCGMPLGPEGPMIHLGSSVGAGLSQFRSETLRFNLPFFVRFRNSEDRRNFISAGAAAGVASAFGAPVGGLLFSMEEVSSFWNMKLTWQIFFCCMLATFTTDLFNSAFSAFSYTGSFGQFKKERYIIFNIANGIDINLLMFIPTVVIGLIGGVLGALFTFLNLKVTRLRRRLLVKISRSSVQKLCRVLEPVVVMILVTTFTIYIQRAFPCSRYICTGAIHGNFSYDCYRDYRTSYSTESEVVTFTCPSGVTYPDKKDPHRVLTNKTYNEIASLLFETSEGAVKHLFSRNSHLEFGYASLFIVLPFYFIVVCWASGTSVSCGILVPMMYIGALYGRIIGVVMVTMFGVHTRGDSYWAWIDPGALALIGSASFFGGVSRLTMAVTVIMLELTNDVQFLLPIMVAVMTAKWVGDYFTHPLYHALLELKCIPFLDQDPTTVSFNTKQPISLELFTAADVMTSPVISLRPHERIATLAHHLLDTKHGGFPVIENVDGHDVFRGLITRLELVVLLKHSELFEESDCGSDEEREDYISTVDYHQLRLDKLDDPRDVSLTLANFCRDDKYSQLYINLRPFINQSAVSVSTSFSLHRAYIIFRSMGLRHIVVTDQHNQVSGIITRKDLMGYTIECRLGELINKRQRRYIYSSDIELDSPGNSM